MNSILPKPTGHNLRAYLLLGAGIVLLLLAFIAGISDNPPAIAAMLAGLLAIVLGIAFRFARAGRRNPGQQLLYWAPRGLCIVTAMFISIFALDVFGEGRGFWETALALFMHLIPTFGILLVLAISWRREWIGGILLIALGVLYVVWSWNKPFAGWALFSIISGPPILAGLLFLLNWRYRNQLRGET